MTSVKFIFRCNVQRTEALHNRTFHTVSMMYVTGHLRESAWSAGSPSGSRRAPGHRFFGQFRLLSYHFKTFPVCFSCCGGKHSIGWRKITLSLLFAAKWRLYWKNYGSSRQKPAASGIMPAWLISKNMHTNGGIRIDSVKEISQQQPGKKEGIFGEIGKENV